MPTDRRRTKAERAALLDRPTRNPIRPKQRAAAASTGAAAVLVWIADDLGVDTASVPAPAWVLIAGAVATAAAIIKRDGLRGAWERLVNGDQPGT